ncbi:hypothetical protein BU16DRAFT_532573 [Lophium mytilinum]|uniref:RING-type domain-containing protein n=1 Tax=Lophium mytilinum TaxID=390894 RepID=A0A6A6RBJ4_9PEZI|nr:hypothetical protein BU16DRAFT_532573 [Lophium mytilinum]
MPASGGTRVHRGNMPARERTRGHGASMPAVQRPSARRANADATTTHLRSRLKDSWLQLVHSLTDIHEDDSTAADELELLHKHEKEGFTPTDDLLCNSLWEAFFDFKTSLDSLTTGPSLDDPTAYGRTTALHDDIGALSTHVCEVLASRTPEEITLELDTLETLHSVGLRAHAQINTGFARILAARLDFDGAYEAASTPVDITAFAASYDGPPVDCTICQEPSSNSSAGPPLLLPCPAAHVFHGPCLESLVNSASACNNRCPNCRHILPVPQSSLSRTVDRPARFSEVGARSAVHAVWQGVQDFMEVKRVFALVVGEPVGVDWMKERGWVGWETVKRGNKAVRGREGGDGSGMGFLEGIFVGDEELYAGPGVEGDSVGSDDEVVRETRANTTRANGLAEGQTRVVESNDGSEPMVVESSWVYRSLVVESSWIYRSRWESYWLNDPGWLSNSLSETSSLSDQEKVESKVDGETGDNSEDEVEEPKNVEHVEELLEELKKMGERDRRTPKISRKEYALLVLRLLIAGLALAVFYN